MTASRRDVPVDVSLGDDFVATVELRRPPANFFDLELLRALADAYEELDADRRCRAIVLCAEGRHFCAGANLSSEESSPFGSAGRSGGGPAALYVEALRLYAAHTPVVAAVHGAAIGGGLGLACSADFRVTCATARFAANFARLGFHQGFGLSVTLPGLVGQQRALELLLTGRRISGTEAHRIGLCDRLVEEHVLRRKARELAIEVATSAPLAVASIRETMRLGRLEALRTAVEREAAEQLRLQRTADFAEGVNASAERREPRFEGT